MMYNQKLAATIKANGKVLREFGDTVYIPFGSEYSIFIKNMNTVRAEVGITIDGKDVLNGDKLVVHANDSVNLERFLETNNHGHKFKFIERTSAIENHRGIGSEDGLVRIEYKYEKPVKHWDYFSKVGQTPPYRDDNYYGKSKGIGGSGFNDGLLRSAKFSTTSNSLGDSGIVACNLANIQYDSYVPQNDVGITSKGEISDQKFVTVNAFETESETHVIVLQLKGTNQGVPVKKAVDVSRKTKCDCCGKRNRASAKFCSGCGTNLEILV